MSDWVTQILANQSAEKLQSDRLLFEAYRSVLSDTNQPRENREGALDFIFKKFIPKDQQKLYNQVHREVFGPEQQPLPPVPQLTTPPGVQPERGTGLSMSAFPQGFGPAPGIIGLSLPSPLGPQGFQSFPPTEPTRAPLSGPPALRSVQAVPSGPPPGYTGGPGPGGLPRRFPTQEEISESKRQTLIGDIESMAKVFIQAGWDPQAATAMAVGHAPPPERGPIAATYGQGILDPRTGRWIVEPKPPEQRPVVVPAGATLFAPSGAPGGMKAVATAPPSLTGTESLTKKAILDTLAEHKVPVPDDFNTRDPWSAVPANLVPEVRAKLVDPEVTAMRQSTLATQALTREMMRARLEELKGAGDVPARSPLAGPEDRDETVLAKEPSGVTAIVRQLVDYKFPLPSGFSLRSPYWQRVMALAAQYDPSFDASQYTVRLRLRQNFTSGTTGSPAANIRSLNTAVAHLDTLKKASEALGNAPVTVWNRIKNFGLTQAGDPRVTRFNNAAAAVEGELATVFKGTSGTDQEIKNWRQQINASQSPAQLRGNINIAIELLSGRLGALRNQYEMGMGKPKDFAFLSPKSREIISKIGVNPDAIDPVSGRKAAATGEAGVVQTPDGKKWKMQDGKMIEVQ